VTALLASLAGGDRPELAQAAVQIALVHLCFNLMGTILIYGVPFLRAIPLHLARRLADLAVRHKTAAIGYIIGLYFVLPLALLGITRATGWGQSRNPPAVVQKGGTEEGVRDPALKADTKEVVKESDPKADAEAR